MTTTHGVPVTADFDFLQSGPQSWDIRVETSNGELMLRNGGNRLTIDGVEEPIDAEREYVGLYRRFAALVAQTEIDVDLAPLRLVADAFLCGRSYAVDPFHE
jgi:D-galactose 1-dehydrogenase